MAYIILSKEKDITNWEKVFATHIPDTGIICYMLKVPTNQ